jgi:protein gp37
MNPTTIDWPGLTHTWNPVVGCRRGCSYCYAAKLHSKRHAARIAGARLPDQYLKPFTEIQFFDKRLYDRDLKKPGPFKIFVGSMTDPEYWTNGQFGAVLDFTATAQQHTFMFLSKNPRSYEHIAWDCFPNCMQGLTLEHICSVDDNFYLAHLADNCPRPFLSIEPLLGHVFHYRSFELMEHIIVGADSSKGAHAPANEWIQSVKDNVPAKKLHWKKSIERYL